MRDITECKDLQDFAGHFVWMDRQGHYKDKRFSLNTTPAWHTTDDEPARWWVEDSSQWGTMKYYLPLDAAPSIVAEWPQHPRGRGYWAKDMVPSKLGVAGILKILAKLDVNLVTIRLQQEDTQRAGHIANIRRNIKSAASDLLIIVNRALEYELVTPEEVAVVKRLSEITEEVIP